MGDGGDKEKATRREGEVKETTRGGMETIRKRQKRERRRMDGERR